MGDVPRPVIGLATVVCAALAAALAPGCSAPPPRCAKVVSSVGAAQSAANSASSGSTVCLSDGSYPRLALTAQKAAPGVRVEPQHPGKATIAGAALSGSGLTIERFRIQGGGVVIAPNSTRMNVSHNLVVGGNYFGVMVCPAEPPDRCNDVSIVGNLFYGSFNEDAIRANVYHDTGDSDPYGLRVDGNEFVGNVEHGGHNDVFQSVWVGDHLYFRNNYIHDFGGQGFFVKDQASAIDTLVAENNLIVRQNKPCNPASLCAGYQLSPFQIFGPVRNASIRHNTVWGQEGGVVTLRGSGWTGPTAVTDNVFYKTYSDSTQFSTAGYTSANNVRCTNGGFPAAGFTTSCSPGFRNSARNDWRTTSGRGVNWVPSAQWFGP
jgi:hypothetical protein